MGEFKDLTFTGVSIYTRHCVYISALSDTLVEENAEHGAVFRWTDGKWSHKSLGVAVIGMCPLEGPPHTLINVGPDGTVVEFTFPGERFEQIDESDEGPSDLVNVRAARTIGKCVYVAGMARHVYRREGFSSWKAIDRELFVPRSRRKVASGLNSIDGVSEKQIYAVGYNGEIWRFDGREWFQEDSPTDLGLNVVRCTPDGRAFACGMAGILLSGKAGQWQIIEHSVTREDFWGMAAFNGSIYLSNAEGVYRLSGNSLSPVRMGLKKSTTTSYLDSADNAMWSVGDKDLAFTTDGLNWALVPRP